MTPRGRSRRSPRCRRSATTPCACSWRASARGAASATPSTRRLSGRYLANVADFLRRAKRHQIFVIVTMGFLPAGTVYDELLNRDTSELVQNVNINYLTPRRDPGVAALLAGRDQGAPRSEGAARRRPRLRHPQRAGLCARTLRRSASRPAAARSERSDVRPRRRRTRAIRLMDDGLVYYVNQVRAAIRRVDPTALVDASFFVPEAPNPTTDRRHAHPAHAGRHRPLAAPTSSTSTSTPGSTSHSPSSCRTSASQGRRRRSSSSGSTARSETPTRPPRMASRR